jgi:radical SAM superfamily enzyme YgiQ (UPF0313 family)
MRVLLVYSCHGTNLLPAPPIGLSYVATATRRAGHEVRFLDLNLSRDEGADLTRLMREFRPRVVGISVRHIDNVVRQNLQPHLGILAGQIAVVRAESRSESREEATVVLGGPAISILREATLRLLDADIAVCGEGEHSFPALLEALERGEPLNRIPGICFRNEGEIVTTHAEPHPRFGPSGMQDWIDWRTYERLGATWAIQTKRGCSLPCSYCTYPVVEGRALRTRPADEIADEMEEIARTAAPRTFDFVDSTFNVPPEHALGVCEEILRRGLKLRLTTMGVNPLHASAELFTLMKRAGFNSMMITPESASATMLESLSKGFSVEDVHRAARLARESGLRCIWFFMLGGPGETRETVEETLSFVEKNLDFKRCLTVIFTGIRILPGTRIAQAAFEEGYLPQGSDLAGPVFYMSPLVSEAAILDRINQAINRSSNIVHAAEEGAGFYTRIVHRALHVAGVAPPYWRFLPHYLNLPFIRSARRKFPIVGTGSKPATETSSAG